MQSLSIGSALALLLAFVIPAQPQTPHTLIYAPGKSITLTLPDSFDINIAATGLHRVRFFARSPDGRIFVTGMHDLSDNTQGSIFILDGWNPQSHTFTRITHYLDHLRNPNNLAFWTDPATRQTWLYLPLTDKLVRYKYSAGENAPSSPPETLLQFPDYGLNYKSGGWHLTRTGAHLHLRRILLQLLSGTRSSPRSHRQHGSRRTAPNPDRPGHAQRRRPPLRPGPQRGHTLRHQHGR
jgi:hypothetical protein